MSNSVETIWKLILDEKEARAGENMIQRLARLIKDKLGGESTKAIDKTTGAIKDQTKALKENEDAAKRSGSAVDSAGKVGGAAGKLRGVGSMLGAGEGLGMVNDIGDTIEGLGELKGVIGQLGPAGAVAGIALVALGLVIADFAKGAQEQADAINEAIEASRSVMDEIAGGATKDDIQEQIEQLQFRRELEKQVLAESQQAYADFVQGIRDAFGPFAGIVEGIVKIIDPREEALATQIEQSNKLIGESEAKEGAYNKALEKGLTAKADAKQAEEELEKARDDAAKEAEKQARDAETAQKKQQADQDKAAAEQERAAEQLAAKQEQIQDKQYQAAQKYGDALVDIAAKSADEATKLALAARLKEVDNRRAFDQDILDMSLDFHASEREEAIARQEEEAADLRTHAAKLAAIRDNALSEETDLLRQRDFLGATKVRERANAQIEMENKAFIDASQEKLRLQKQEDAQQLRELDKARRDRLSQLQRANEEARIQYKRDLDAQRETRRIAEREAANARDRELRSANEMARALLGINQQTGQAQLQIAQQTLNSLRGMGNTTNNNTSNSSTWNGNMVFNNGAQIPNTQIANQMLGALGTVGLI
jgi:hypothetical protein